MMEPGGGPEGIHGDRDKSGEAARRDRDRREGRALLRQRAGGQARRAPPAPQNDQGGRAEGDREHEIRHGGVHVPRRRARPRRLLEEPLRLVRELRCAGKGAEGLRPERQRHLPVPGRRAAAVRAGDEDDQEPGRGARPPRVTTTCHDVAIDTTRVDIWLWAVRIYKTRSSATAACRGGHVRVNRATAKASTPVKLGDRVEAFAE